MYKSLNPFSIAAACREVQKAWLAHPYQLGEELIRLSTRALALATSQCAAGRPSSGDLIPAAAHDERFQHPLWSQNPVLDTVKEIYLL